MLDERDEAHLVHIQCSQCGSSIVALIMSSALGITSVGLVTDLTGDDVLRFKDELPVSADEALQVYELLTARAQGTGD